MLRYETMVSLSEALASNRLCEGLRVTVNRDHAGIADYPYCALVNNLGRIVSHYAVDHRSIVDVEFFSDDFCGMIRGASSEMFMVE